MYEYYVQNAGTNNGYYLSTAQGSTDQVQFSNNATRLKVKIVALTGDDAGKYQIEATNGPISGKTLIGCTGSNEGAKVQYGSSSENLLFKWYISLENAVGVKGYYMAYSICPENAVKDATSGNSWNFYAGVDASNLALYRHTDQGSKWNFVPANAAAVNKFIEQIQIQNQQPFAPTSNNPFSVSVSEAVKKLTGKSDMLAANLTKQPNNSIEINIPTGYYRLRNADVDGENKTFSAYLFSDYSKKFAGADVSNTLANVPVEADAYNNNYIWHLTKAEGSNEVAILSGQGVGVHNGTEYKTIHTGLSDYWRSGMVYFTEGLHITNQAQFTVNNLVNSDAEATQTNPFKMTNWDRTDSKGSAYYLEPVDLTKYDIYTVTIKNGAAGNYVKYHDMVALNGGFFLSTTSAPITPDQLTVTCAEGSQSQVTIDTDTKAINVIIISPKPMVDRVKGLAQVTENDVLTKRGVGFPLTSCEEYSNLQSAINNAKNATETNAQELYDKLVVALQAYKTTSNVQFPEDGHTYVITNMHLTQEKKYLNYAESGLTYESRGTGSAESLPQSAKFTCHKVNDKYVFANNDGKYLVWKGKNSGANENKGYTDGYDETYCPLTLKKMGTDGYVNASAETFFGYLSIFGKGCGDLSVFLTPFDNDGSGKVYYQNTWSSAMQFEEVAYDNKVTPNSTEGKITGADYIATFSAPFATVIPEGVTAWYVERNDTKAEMHAVEGQAIPAKTGVILTATSADAFYMVPAAGEVTATIQSNELGNSAGQAIELAEGQGYILGKGGQGVAFYKAAAGTLPRNRAYLQSNGSSANTISMVFGDATGISDILTPADAVNAPIYDLSGRRVNKALKGGLYIQNGRKVIVK